MIFDAAASLGAVTRCVEATERDGKPARVVILSRHYRTGIEDLWDAVTNPERLRRWFASVEGELRIGGRYQVVGNAGGTITACEAPRLFDLTWEFGGGVSWVELRLQSEVGGQTRLTLNHIVRVDEHWTKFGPGAVGIGWEIGLHALAQHQNDPSVTFNEEAFLASPEAGEFIRGSVEGWREAHVGSDLDAGQAQAAAQRAWAAYTGNAASEG